MSDITILLRAARQGDRLAAERAWSLLYGELQHLARSRLRRAGDLTLLDTGALVHESFLRVQGQPGLDFPDRQHFLAYASRVMRAVVVDLVRARQAERRGGGAEHISLDTALGEALAPDAVRQAEVLQVHEALDALARAEPRLAEVVEMRYFGGLSETEIAEALGVTERTVQRDWQKARLFLSLAMK